MCEILSLWFFDIYQAQAASIKPLKLLSKITHTRSIPQQAWMEQEIEGAFLLGAGCHALNQN
jgi:hypothetical protein